MFMLVLEFKYIMVDVRSIEFAVKQVFYWQVYSHEVTVFSFRTINVGVHFHGNFAQAHLIKAQ